MCGIVGYRGSQDGVPIVLDGLSRLEYRGYDSAGIVAFDGDEIHLVRAAGKLSALRGKIAREKLSGAQVLGHTRWATHGPPTEKNAHPQRAGSAVVVHNGIFENAAELREKLKAEGVKFSSATDTEILAHLVDKACRRGKPLVEAVRKALSQVSGAYAVLVASAGEPGTIVAARWGCPLVVGVGAEKSESYFASDIPALLPYTREFFILEDGEVAVATAKGVSFQDFTGKTLKRTPKTIPWDAVSAERGGYKHFMHKEIHEQPQALVSTLGAHFDANRGKTTLDDLKLPPKPRRAVLVACGTSHHAALVGKFWLERLAKLPTEVDIASEFRYRDPLLGRGDLVVFLSQSGETADTLAALKLAGQRGAFTLAICNVPESSIPRAARATLYTHAGPEVGVAATKTFLAQLLALLLLALHYTEENKTLAPAKRKELVRELLRLPKKIEQTLALEPDLERLAREHHGARDFLFLGRGINYPIALEGALKLKEISYLHAEGYPAGEMKHGPIALLDERLPALFLAPHDESFPKISSNVEEASARGAPVILIESADGKKPVSENLARARRVVVPSTHPLLYPFVLTPPLQLLAYHIASLKGCDVDQPRNLAKSVTVE